MGSASALSILRKLSVEMPISIKADQSLSETLGFLHQQLPFAQFAIAKATPRGEFPPQDYFPSTDFPVFDPRCLHEAAKTLESQIDSLNQILIVPCIGANKVVGALLAYRMTETLAWTDIDRTLVEIAAQELARTLVDPTPLIQDPGLTLGAPLKGQILRKNAAGFSRSRPPVLIGQSDRLRTVLQMIDRVAPTSASVLILGESGTGKELIAKRIHALSDRSDQSFIAINCGAITETLLESELFGHEKGSFTGASQQKRGLVELANQGTLFLDEIGEMAPSLQAKLLRFLQEGEFYRVGGKEPIHVDCRIISATNRNLDGEVQNGRFREDLFYRLNTISIQSPALRDRKEDIPLLIEAFSPGLLASMTPDALAAIQSYSWPGNIRELQNLIERLRILSAGESITAQKLPLTIRSAQQKIERFTHSAPPIDMKLDELERVHILRCLDHFEGNKTRAAQSLGITIKTLYNKLHRYGIFDKPDPQEPQKTEQS